MEVGLIEKYNLSTYQGSKSKDQNKLRLMKHSNTVVKEF